MYTISDETIVLVFRIVRLLPRLIDIIQTVPKKNKTDMISLSI